MAGASNLIALPSWTSSATRRHSLGGMTGGKYKNQAHAEITYNAGGAYQQEIVQKVIQRLYTRFSIYPQRNKLANHGFFRADRTATLLFSTE
jgi:hypothetical protein